MVVPPSKKFAPKHRACAAGDGQGLTETCSGCGRILQKCRDCQRILWPRTEREFIFEDERFVENLLATCGFKYKVRNVDIDWVKKTVEDHKKKTCFHLRPYLVRDDCDRCKKTHKACSLCGQIFFAEEQTPRYSGNALNEYTGFLHVFDRVVDERLSSDACTLEDLQKVFHTMCPNMDVKFPFPEYVS